MRRFLEVLIGVCACLAASTAPAQHATAFDIENGALAYAASCANCHGPDGDLIEGIHLGRGEFRRDYSDAELVGIIVNGIPNTPMPPTPSMTAEQADRIVAYLRSLAADAPQLALVGDPARGRRLFEGEGGCLDCHRVHGNGSRIGPDLTSIGRQRRSAEIETSLIDPAAEIQPTNRFYRVTTASGDTVEGRLLNHDSFTVQLMDTEERLRSFEKSALREHGFVGTPMPSAREELDPQQIADVVSYLTSLRGQL